MDWYRKLAVFFGLSLFWVYAICKPYSWNWSRSCAFVRRFPNFVSRVGRVASNDFSSGTSIFPFHQKPTFDLTWCADSSICRASCLAMRVQFRLKFIPFSSVLLCGLSFVEWLILNGGFSTGYVKGNNYSCDNVLNKIRNERREEEGRRERSRDVARLELKRAHKT